MTSIRNAVIALAVLVAAIFAYFQINDYFEHKHLIAQQRTAIQKSIAESTEAISDLLNIEIHPGAITYAEVFERGDDRIKKASDAIIPIGTSSLPPDEKAALKKYVQGLQELIRMQIAENRKEISSSTILNRSKETVEEYTHNTNDYSRDFYRQRAEKALAESQTAVKELGNAQKDFVENIKSFRKLMEVLRPALKDYSLVDDQFLNDLLEKVSPKKS